MSAQRRGSWLRLQRGLLVPALNRCSTKSTNGITLVPEHTRFSPTAIERQLSNRPDQMLLFDGAVTEAVPQAVPM